LFDGSAATGTARVVLTLGQQKVQGVLRDFAAVVAAALVSDF
jgi:hypothetical protein